MRQQNQAVDGSRFVSEPGWKCLRKSGGRQNGSILDQRIEMIVTAEFVIQLRMLVDHTLGLLEKYFRVNRKDFGGVGCRIGAKQGCLPARDLGQ